MKPRIFYPLLKSAMREFQKLAYGVNWQDITSWDIMARDALDPKKQLQEKYFHFK